MARKEFEMSQAQLDTMVAAIKSEPLIMLQCGMPRSMQEKANDAWDALGKEMGFVGDTARPVYGKDATFFTAEAVEPVENAG